MDKFGEVKVSESNDFSVILNRQYLNKEKFEVDRFARYTNHNYIYYDSFYLDKNPDFDGISYPYENLSFPLMSEEDWISGKKFETSNNSNQTKKKENIQDNEVEKNNSLDTNQNQNELSNNENNKKKEKKILKKEKKYFTK